MHPDSCCRAHNKQVVEQESIALRHYPFEPMTSIAQSPSEDNYYAGYHIPKLICVDVNSKSEILFPIEIMSSSSNIDIKDLHVSSIGSGIITDIHIIPQTNKNGNSSPELFLSEAPLSKMEITHR